MNKNKIVQHTMKWCRDNNLIQNQKIMLDFDSLKKIVGICMVDSRDEYIPKKRLICWEQKVERLNDKLKEYKQDRASYKLLTRNLSKNIGW